jgi:methyl-accepting chemotaxis protein/methyl-accepting chemotaxis protein-1 (serine sensor receptor)
MVIHKRFYSVRALRYTVAVSFIVAAGSGVTSIYLAGTLARGNEVLTEIGTAKSDSATLYALGLQMCQATRNILLDPGNKTADANFNSAAKDFQTALGSLKQRAEQLFSDKGDTQELLAIERDFKAHVVVQRQIHDLARSGDFERGKQTLNSEDTPLWRRYKQTMLDFGKRLEKEANQVSGRIQHNSRLAQASSWFSGLLLVAASLIALITSNRFARCLQELAQVLAEGANQITSAAEHVSGSSETLAQGASEQASSLQETSASTEQINAMARKNSENSRSAAEVVTQSKNNISATSQALEEMVAAMEEMNHSSEQISKVIKVIDEIAFQTNILALNAAIEAARAGSAGLGFGVVADEVRTLSQRCAEAAGNTASLIQGSVTKTHEGKERMNRVATAFRELTGQSEKVGTLVEQVGLGSAEQARGIQQIAKAITQIEQVTQHTAATAEESASAAEELSAQSHTLRTVVERLTALIGGSK